MNTIIYQSISFGLLLIFVVGAIFVIYNFLYVIPQSVVRQKEIVNIMKNPPQQYSEEDNLKISS
jgi:hypothetical protein